MLQSEDHGAVRVLTLDRPERRNAFTPEAYRMLGDALAIAADDDAVHVVVLTGAGAGFCAGVDLVAFRAAGEETSEFGLAFEVLVDGLISFPKPLLAAVHGAAVGFGATILLHCDVVLVAPDARLRFPFVPLQTAPEAASSYLLARAVGEQRAAELLFTARWVEAGEAVAIGLAARECTDVVADALRLAQAIAEQPAGSVQLAKRLLRHGRADEARAAVARETAGAAELGSDALGAEVDAIGSRDARPGDPT